MSQPRFVPSARRPFLRAAVGLTVLLLVAQASLAQATAKPVDPGAIEAVRTVPPGCVPVNYGGMIYQQCGSTWYQPQGPQYVVVYPPY